LAPLPFWAGPLFADTIAEFEGAARDLKSLFALKALGKFRHVAMQRREMLGHEQRFGDLPNRRADLVHDGGGHCLISK